MVRLPFEMASYRFPATPATPSSGVSVESSEALAPDGSALETEPTSPAPRGNDAVDDVADPQQHLEKARELRASGDLAGAAQEFERAVYLDPYSVEIRTELAEVFEEMGELEKAAGELQIVLWNHEDGPTLLRLAELYESMGELDKARAQAARATELDGEDVRARELLERLSSLTTSQP